MITTIIAYEYKVVPYGEYSRHKPGTPKRAMRKVMQDSQRVCIEAGVVFTSRPKYRTLERPDGSFTCKWERLGFKPAPGDVAGNTYSIFSRGDAKFVRVFAPRYDVDLPVLPSAP